MWGGIREGEGGKDGKRIGRTREREDDIVCTEGGEGIREGRWGGSEGMGGPTPPSLHEATR